MNMKQARMNYYGMRPAEEINSAIAQLPTAEECDLFALAPQNGEGNNRNLESLDNFKAIKVNMGDYSTYVSVPTKRYRLVQHADAFRPVVEGLTQAGVHDFGFSTIYDERRAKLQVYATDEAADTVSVGFEVINSFDKSKALTFGFWQHREQSYIEVVGYRQVCENGMKVRVPLEDAEIIRPELKTQLDNIFSGKLRYIHNQSVDDFLYSVQYIVEAVSLLREPVANMIEKAQDKKFDSNKLKEIVNLHVGKRFKQKVLNQYEEEEQSLWGLYNAITYIASHENGLRASTRERLQEKAANMLMVEVRTE